MKKSLLLIGDSLIEYFDWAGRFQGHAVYNLGIGGETVGGLLQRLERVCRAVAAPDRVLIMSGINNLAMDDDSFLPEYAKIIEGFAAAYPQARIILQSLLPVLNPFISNDDIRKVNAELKALAAEKGAGYLDIHSHFIESSGAANPGYLLDDGVHVSEEGYAVWSAEVEKLLNF